MGWHVLTEGEGARNMYPLLEPRHWVVCVCVCGGGGLGGEAVVANSRDSSGRTATWLESAHEESISLAAQLAAQYGIDSGLAPVKR
jgi:hypothetical protein